MRRLEKYKKPGSCHCTSQTSILARPASSPAYSEASPSAKPIIAMLALNLATIAMMAIYGQAALAAATLPDESKDFMAGVDTSNWISVDFRGTTITYNPSILNVSASATAMVKARAPDAGLRPRAACSTDCCGDSSFVGTNAPWAREGDCAAIRDWAYAQNKAFSIWTNTPDYHGVVFAGTCAFGAGTLNALANTYVGSSDIGDLTRDGIRRFAVSVP